MLLSWALIEPLLVLAMAVLPFALGDPSRFAACRAAGRALRCVGVDTQLWWQLQGGQRGSASRA